MIQVAQIESNVEYLPEKRPVQGPPYFSHSFLPHLAQLPRIPIPIRVYCAVSPSVQCSKIPVRENDDGHTLDKAGQYLTTSLQQRMPNNNLQEALQALPPMLNHIITEPIRKYFSRQRWNGHASSLPLKNVTKVFKIGVAAPDSTMLEFEGWYVRSAYNLIVGIHVS